MSTFRVTFEEVSRRGPRGTMIYNVPFALTSQQAVAEARKFAAVECPGYRLKGVEEVSAELEHAAYGPYIINRKKARPARKAAQKVAA